MEIVTLSDNYQIVISQQIRDQCGLQPGQRLLIALAGDRIELVPVKPMKVMRGFVRGLNTDVFREEDRL